MATSARLPIAAPRVGACVRTMIFRGVSLAGCTLELQARLTADAPGLPLVDLQTVADPTVEGITIGQVTIDPNGVVATPVTIRIAEATMKDPNKVPYMGELGDPGILAFALVGWGGDLGADKRLLVSGDLIAQATAYGSDNAPAGRLPSFQRLDAWSGTNAATIEWSAGTIVQVSIDGVDALGAEIKRATDAADAAQAALGKALAASIAGPAAMKALSTRLTIAERLALPTLNGLISRADGTIAGWRGDLASWPSIARPALVSFAPSRIIAQAPGAAGALDAGGVRESLFFDDTGVGYISVFADDFSSEAVGPLGGQNGWVDSSGGNAKPQVTAGAKLDMQSAIGASLVYRPGALASVRQSATLNLGATAGVGFAFGYASGTSHYRVDVQAPNAAGAGANIVVVFVAASGAEANLKIWGDTTIAGYVPVGSDFGFAVSSLGATITVEVNGHTLSWTEADANRAAVMQQAGGVAIRNGFAGVGPRIVDNYSVQNQHQGSGKLYALYTAGDGSPTDAGGPWRPQYAVSDDRGVTWTKKGYLLPGDGLGHGYDAGSYPARDVEYIMFNPDDGLYYIYLMTAGSVVYNQVCGQPYYSDVWTTPDLSAMKLTYVGPAINLNGRGGRFDSLDCYIGSVVKIAGKWYAYYSATSLDSSGSQQWYIGLATANTAAGPFVSTGQALLGPSSGFQLENPRAFYNAPLAKWVMLCNVVNKALGVTDRNVALFSANPLDWSAATYSVTQRLSAMDGTGAIGLAEPLHKLGTDGNVDIDAQGSFAVTFDTDPTDGGGYGYHTGRRIKYAVNEAFVAELSGRYTTAGILASFADDFSSEAVGALGGQNGWVDGSGGNAKPQVTALHTLDMGSAPAPSLVSRPAAVASVRQQIGVKAFDPGCGVGLLFGYGAGQAFYLVDFTAPVAGGNADTISVVYFASDGGQTILKLFRQAGLVGTGAGTLAAAVDNETITIVAADGSVLRYTETDATRLAALRRPGGVGIRNGSAGNGARVLSSYALSSSVVAPGYLFRSRPHASFVADLVVRANQLGGSITFFYRVQDEDSYDGRYVVTLSMAGGAMGVSLSKVTGGGMVTMLATTAAGVSAAAQVGTANRVTISVVGGRHIIQVDGETHLTAVDDELPFGLGFGLSISQDAAVGVIGPIMRASNEVRIKGASAGHALTLRGVGHVPLVTAQTTGGTVELSSPHYPASSVDLDSVDVVVRPGAIWGGDSIDLP